MIELLPEKGNLYKANLHCHTDLSDGKQTLEEVKAAYKAQGYSSVCFTDHEVLLDHKDLCDPDFIALHGYEVSVKKDLNEHTGCFMPVYHFNMLAKDQNNLKMPLFFKNNPSMPGNARHWAEECALYDETIDTTHYDIEWLNQYLKGVKEAGFLITYNHPAWSLQTGKDVIPLEHLHAVEVSNGGCQHWGDNTARIYEQLLRAGKRVVPIGGGDNHAVKDCFWAWTVIKAPELTYEALMAAYERGDCYCSEGPDILSLTIEDGKVRVKTSPAAWISILSEGRYGKCVRSRTETFTEAEFDYVPEKFGRYFRIEVRDAAGYRAFSNAYYTAEIKE